MIATGGEVKSDENGGKNPQGRVKYELGSLTLL